MGRKNNRKMTTKILSSKTIDRLIRQSANSTIVLSKKSEESIEKIEIMAENNETFKALDIINSMKDDLTKAQSLLDEYRGKILKLDLAQQDILHYIENDTFNAPNGYSYAKALKILRLKRRYYKRQIPGLQSLTSLLEESINKAIRNITKDRDQFFNATFDDYRDRVLERGANVIESVTKLLDSM